MNWKKWVYFVVAGAVLVSGIGTVVYFGLQPRSVPKINLSHFARPEDAGAALAKRLWLEFKNAPAAVIGIWPGRAEEIAAVQGLLAALTREPGTGYDIVLVEDGLLDAGVFPDAQRVSLRNDVPGIAEGLRKALAQGRRVLIVAPSMYSSQLVAEGPAQRLNTEMLPAGVMSVSLAPFPLTREAEAASEVRCQTGEERSGVGALGCAVVQRARSMYRKKKTPGQFAVAADLVGASDYIFLLAPVP